MKKLLVMSALVCVAIASHASSVSWSSPAVPYFLDTASLDGNKSYAVSSTQMNKSGYTFAYTLAVTGVASASGTVGYNFISGKFMNNGITVGGTGAIATGTTYDYVITMTTSLSGIGKTGGWDYSSAVATATLTGQFTGATGASALQSGVPTEWVVTGAVQDTPGPTPIPEPTSGLLMLVGMAGLALRRKQK